MEELIGLDDPRATDVQTLLRAHLAFANEHSPPEDVHALDVDGLVDPAVTFYSLRRGGMLLAIGALRRLDETHAEVKSMHTVSVARGEGIGSRMLAHLIAEARAHGYQRLSLETGSMAAFGPARSLYLAAGFVPCEPFGSYVNNSHSVCMTLALGPDPFILELLQKAVARDIRLGRPDDDVLDNALEELRGQLAVDLIVDEVARHSQAARRAQNSWARPTDVERMIQGFKALERNRLFIGWAFGLYLSRALDDIHALFREAPGQYRGYAFFTYQEMEQVAEQGGALRMSYGGPPEASDEVALEVGREVCRALEAAGVKVTFAGAMTDFIRLDIDWRVVREPDCFLTVEQLRALAADR